MKYLLLLTRSLFIATTILLTVIIANGTDCTPIARLLRDETSGACGFGNSDWLSKDGYWYVTWPDGTYDEPIAHGGGRCSWQSRCETLPMLDSIYCWPDFYPPVTTKWGDFSILIENKVIEEVTTRCGVSIFVEVRKSCVSNGRTTVNKNHICAWGDGGGGGGEVCQYDDSGCEDCVPDDGLAWQNCWNLEAQWFGVPYCSCSDPSPILVDVSGNGFRLTSRENGVMFDLNVDGTKNKIPWTTTGTDDSWLCLDRDGNGTIDNGAELFGNFAPQPEPPLDQEKNGFLALAEYDKPVNGGNGDGSITQSDAVFGSLRLWQDRNQNGISEPSEFLSLQAAHVAAIECDYKLSKRTDEYGNNFRYRAKVKDTKETQVGRWAWDVFLVAR
jgi:hypothetical protein